MKEHTTMMLPPPKEELDPETALKWLQDDYPCIFGALKCGYSSEDSETREDFSIVAGDVWSLHTACVDAVAQQKPVHIFMEKPPGHLDYEDHTLSLSRVVAHRCSIFEGSGYYEDGFAWFAEVLAGRLRVADGKSSPRGGQEVSESQEPSADMEQPPTESASQEPRLEVARILRERVANRLYLIGDITETETTIREGDDTIRRFDYDREIDAVVCDTVKLVEALAQYLETGTLPEHKSQLGNRDLAGRLLGRASGNTVAMNSVKLLAKELAGEWDSKSPAEVSA